LESSKDLVTIMGACCTKFGSYLLRKEESKVMSNGGTPKLNKLEHKQSFVVVPTANGVKTSDGNVDLSPQHHEDKLQPNEVVPDENPKEVVKSRSRSSSSSSSSSSDKDSIGNEVNQINNEIECQEVQEALEKPNLVPETATLENKESEIAEKSSSEDLSQKEMVSTNDIPQAESVIVQTFETDDFDTKSNSSRKSSSSESQSETEVTANDVKVSVSTDTKTGLTENMIVQPDAELSENCNESPVPDVETPKSPMIEISPASEPSESSSSSESNSEIETGNDTEIGNLTNGDSHIIETSALTQESEYHGHSDNSGNSSSSDDEVEKEAIEEEVEETEPEKVSKIEVQSYAQLVTPAGFASGSIAASEEASNDHVEEVAENDSYNSD